ncbi:hypothetical protein JXA47_02645 [Candidatus Sumerlaeota bacterium]|nr:hypothetical protein [Candidatus Sumerlaeota bacterium]
MAKRSSPKTPVFLLHGEDTAAMGLERSRLIEKLVSEEMRAENVTEIQAPGSQPLRLRSCLADILDDLATASFFPEHRRVVVIHDLQELTAKPTKESAPLCERLAAFLRESLAEIGNAAIFVVTEDSERWKSLQRASPITKAIAEVGTITHFPTDNLSFALQDALLARRGGECLQILARRLGQARASDRLGVLRSVFNDVVKFSRFLLQAKMRRRTQTPTAFPDDKRLNLGLQHQVVQKKVRSAATRFKTPELISLRSDLQRANRHFAPSLEDAYVADQRLLLEHLILRMCGSKEA